MEINPERSLEILQLKPGASPAEIRQAYLDLVQVWHPDRFVGNERMHRRAEEKLRELNEAYRLLESAPQTKSTSTKFSQPVLKPLPAEESPDPAPQTRKTFQELLGVAPPGFTSMQQQSLVVLGIVALLFAGGWAGNRIYDSFARPASPQTVANGVENADDPSGPVTSNKNAPTGAASRRAQDSSRVPANQPAQSPVLMDAGSPVPQGSVAGDTGEIDVYNDTVLEADVALIRVRAPMDILSRSTLPVGGNVVLRGLIPESYWVDVTFSGFAQNPVRLGPFAIVRTTGEKGRVADRYEVHLRPQSKP
ncbi:MAG: DnaJ domain-containing protein [Bryobacteraceae bacterium]